MLCFVCFGMGVGGQGLMQVELCWTVADIRLTGWLTDSPLRLCLSHVAPHHPYFKHLLYLPNRLAPALRLVTHPPCQLALQSWWHSR